MQSLGATWVRAVARPEHDLTGYFRELQQRGIRTLLVLARESFSGFASHADGVAHWSRRYGDLVAAWQIGNEPDLKSPSSWDMPVSDFVALGKMARAALPGAHIVCAGLASGHPEYLDGADLSWCDTLAVHPYLKDAPNPSDLEDLTDMDVLVREYGRFGKPVIVSEWGWWGAEEKRATEEVTDATSWAGATSDCAAFFYFSLLDDVPPFGLLSADGSAKPRAAAFKKYAASARDLGWPNAAPMPARPNPWEHFTAEAIATAAQCPLAAVREHWPRLVEQLGHCRINDRPTQIAMIGTVAIESASTFAPVREAYYLGEPEPAESYRRTLRYYPFYGRGYIQNTWEDAYRELGPKIAALWGTPMVPELDLVAVPDRALDPDISAAAAALYFRDHGGEGAALIPAAARAGNWGEVRRLVYGGQDEPGAARLAQIARALGTAAPTPGPAPDRRDELIAAYELALRHLRDVTLPAVERELREAQRIVRQFIGDKGAA